MKKKILLIILLAILGSIKVNAFTVAQIHVSVSNSQTGLSIASHPVIITDSAGFNHTYYTNAYGQFNDSIYNAATTPVKYYIITYDCNNLMHYDTVTTFGWVYKSANFNICHVGADLGILEIINPGDTSFISGLQTIPVVKVKNFSSDTVSGIHFGYKINGQLFTQFFYAYDLLPNATNYFNLSGFTTPSSNFTFCAFLMNTDNNSANDTLCKTVVIANPYNDAGVVEVLTPLNSVIAGDSVAPVIKFKNYGTNTLTSVNIGYRPKNWGPFVIETWTGNLPYDSTAIFAFNQKFQVQSTFDLHIEVYTFLTGDQNWHNDSVLKILPITPVNYDAGIVQIINPVSALTGDTINPQIKIKNFGNQPLTSVPVKYFIDGQLVGNAICNLNIAPNSTVNYTFPQYFVCSSNQFCIGVFTLLANDTVVINDTAHLCITPLPAIKDAGIIKIINPADVVCTGNTIYPKVIIKNFGQTPLSSIPIAYQRGSLTPVTAIWTGSPLNYGDTVSYTFVTPFTVPSGASFAIAAYTNLANDGYTLNNKITKSVTIANSSTLPFNITGDDTIVAGQTNVLYQAGSSQSGQYVWTLPPGAFLDSVYNNFIIVHFANNAQSGNITCKIITPCGVTPTSVFPIYVFTTPPPPIISLGTNHIMYSGYSTGNQWYFENNAIQGANSQTYTATQTGHYYCKVSINGSTSAQSNTIYVGFTGLDEAYVKTDFEVYPNPANDKLFFRYTIDKADVVELKLMDIEGRCIKSILNDKQTAGEYKLETDINDLDKGMYFYQFRFGESVLSGKLIVVK